MRCENWKLLRYGIVFRGSPGGGGCMRSIRQQE